ncbi:MAG: molybdenum cofactor biosynthesis protein MoaE [Nocardioides sp.]|uniref:molybdenum cofactor biosynthesis protein MoaE n=1 Tax=Nocardioides sp. TaxID=35761 RepID=UPI0039E4B708
MSPIRLVDLRDAPLDVTEVLAALEDGTSGGVDLFVGRVRDHDHGQGVSGLVYEAHPCALAELEAVAHEVADAYDVTALAVLHRTGSLAVGEIAVIAGTASAHRAATFEATRALIDTLKARVPIWKHQRFADGSSEWVGLP